MITHQRLLEVIHYDPTTGAFTWRIQLTRKCGPGRPAGTQRDDGYLTVSIDKIRYRAHRLAWFYMTGEWPLHFVDHKDENKGNNSWLNLRLATKSQNGRNIKLKRNNTSGVKGVSLNSLRGKYDARISGPSGQKCLGLFGTLQEAADAVRAARIDMHGEFVNHG